MAGQLTCAVPESSLQGGGHKCRAIFYTDPGVGPNDENVRFVDLCRAGKNSQGSKAVDGPRIFGCRRESPVDDPSGESYARDAYAC